MAENNQRIRYVRTPENINLAWAEVGSGPALVKAANWMTHLEFEWQSPVWRHWIRFFNENFRYIRFDERGCGMTDWNVGDISFDRWVEDLETVIAAANIDEPTTLLGISQGAATCIAYSIKHPEKVSRMILYGGYARGLAHYADCERKQLYQAMIELTRLKWGDENPTFRQVFTSRFIPDGTDEQIGWFNELCKKTTNAENAAKLLEARADVDVRGLLEKVSVPTLVLHSRDDAVIPVSVGHELAAGIPGAEFVELDSKNHVLLEHEPAWDRFCAAVLDFMDIGNEKTDDVFSELTPRELEVLTLLTEGLSNANIAERLSINEKTVRNHISNLFDKLGVWSRSQAIVFAHDHNFPRKDRA
jgi:pimeloyl-ACP methyl ester carboxylesterase/DNA-binding CsgD family transcriptional regulator